MDRFTLRALVIIVALVAAGGLALFSRAPASEPEPTPITVRTTTTTAPG